MPQTVTSMRRDLASAYVVVATRLLGWAAVSAVVYRKLGAEPFAVLSLIRSTVGLLTFTSLGLAPAMIRLLAEAARPAAAPPVEEAAVPAGGVLSYVAPETSSSDTPLARVYVSGASLAITLGLAGVAVLAVYVGLVPGLHRLRGEHEDAARWLAWGLGTGLLLRLVSDAPSALLQVRGRLWLDNLLLAGGDVVWVAGSLASVAAGRGVAASGTWFAVSNAALLVTRVIAARAAAGENFSGKRADAATRKALLAFGAVVTLGQVADFLYSPVDYILITRLLDLRDAAFYAPAVQIDSGLLVLVSGIASVLLPHAALAHASGNAGRVRRYYLRGTLASTMLLAAAAAAVWATSPWVFRFWLGDEMPGTRAILPLVLIHTVVGGSSAVGRSILLGMGRVKAFTASVLIAGVANVLLSYVFVRYFGWGLVGIVLGTIVAVVARAGLWMPWYVLRTLKTAGGQSSVGTR